MIVLNAELKSMNSNLTYVSVLSRCVSNLSRCVTCDVTSWKGEF